MKHSFMCITTNFDLKPVLEDFFDKYANGEFLGYQIVFETQDEHEEGTNTYIVVFQLNRGKKEHQVQLAEFLKSYSVLNKLRYVAQPQNNILPALGRGGK